MLLLFPIFSFLLLLSSLLALKIAKLSFRSLSTTTIGFLLLILLETEILIHLQIQISVAPKNVHRPPPFDNYVGKTCPRQLHHVSHNEIPPHVGTPSSAKNP